MAYECKIVADTIAQTNGVRLTTFEVTYPLIIHAEVMTHRVFSRNIASNRAIPVKKLIKSVLEDPFIPERFPKNQAGMQSSEWLEGTKAKLAKVGWLAGRTAAVWAAKGLMKLGVHKQIANRLLAPFLWTTAVITATDWENFFALRCHPMAQPEIQKIAYLMRDAYELSEPEYRTKDGWHIPYVSVSLMNEITESFVLGEGYDEQDLIDTILLVSIGRCARVSYLNHGEGNPWQKDLELAKTLIKNNHMSPTEHVATPTETADYCGNFRGWKQYRKTIPNESGQTLF